MTYFVNLCLLLLRRREEGEEAREQGAGRVWEDAGEREGVKEGKIKNLNFQPSLPHSPRLKYFQSSPLATKNSSVKGN